MSAPLIFSSEQRTEFTNVFIYTIPRSSTMSLRNFFVLYSRNVAPNYHCWVEHDECPDFAKTTFDPDTIEKWRSLTYHPTLSWLGIKILDRTYPKKLEKIVFVYRNPLDQVISYYRLLHDPSPVDSDCKIDLKDLEEFMFRQSAVESYLKQYLTFKLMDQKVPGQILFVPYEELTSDRINVLRKMLDHLGLPFDADSFHKYAALTRIDHLRAVATGQISDPEVLYTLPDNHIRDGSTGIWRTIMTPDMIRRSEEIFNQHGLSLYDFQLEAKSRKCILV